METKQILLSLWVMHQNELTKTCNCKTIMVSYFISQYRGEEFWGSSHILVFFDLLWKGIYVDLSRIALIAAYSLVGGWIVRVIDGYLIECTSLRSWTLYLKLAVFWLTIRLTVHVIIGHCTLVIGCRHLVRTSECWWTLSLHKCTLIVGLVITSTETN